MTAHPQRGWSRHQLAAQLAQCFTATSVLIGDLAAEVGRSPSLVRRLLEEAGLRTEGQSGVGMSEAELVPVLAARYRSGVSIDRLHRDTGIDRRKIRRLLSEHGVRLRTRKSLPAAGPERLVGGRYPGGDRSVNCVQAVVQPCTHWRGHDGAGPAAWVD